MNTYLVFRRNALSSTQELEKAAGRFIRVATQEMHDRVRWIRSYVVWESNGRIGTVCVFQGRDADAILEHARRSRLPYDEAIPVAETVVINDDPVLIT